MNLHFYVMVELRTIATDDFFTRALFLVQVGALFVEPSFKCYGRTLFSSHVRSSLKFWIALANVCCPKMVRFYCDHHLLSPNGTFHGEPIIMLYPQMVHFMESLYQTIISPNSTFHGEPVSDYYIPKWCISWRSFMKAKNLIKGRIILLQSSNSGTQGRLSVMVFYHLHCNNIALLGKMSCDLDLL